MIVVWYISTGHVASNMLNFYYHIMYNISSDKLYLSLKYRDLHLRFENY